MGISLSIDHIIPIAAGGPTTRENLWLACRSCNEFKGYCTHARDPDTGTMVLLFNPRTMDWRTHFTWDEDKTHIIGASPIGRATVEALQLNRPLLVKARHRWVAAGWPPPDGGIGNR